MQFDGHNQNKTYIWNREVNSRKKTFKIAIALLNVQYDVMVLTYFSYFWYSGSRSGRCTGGCSWRGSGCEVTSICCPTISLKRSKIRKYF